MRPGHIIQRFALAKLLRYKMLSVASVQVDEDTARKKDEIALKLAVGEINVLQSEDVFEGLTPKVRTTGP